MVPAIPFGMGSQILAVAVFLPRDLKVMVERIGEVVRIDISVPWEQIAIINTPFLPAPTNLHTSVSMAKEGP